MSYEKRINETHSTSDDCIGRQAFDGFDCMKREAAKVCAEADAEIARLRTALKFASSSAALMGDVEVVAKCEAALKETK